MRRRYRGGSQAAEFAVILPVLLAIILGTMEYGWYFFKQSQAFHAVSHAAREASMEVPSDADGSGTGNCTPCIDAAEVEGVNSLADIGITVNEADLNATISVIEGTCAIQLAPDVPYTSLTGFVPVPYAFSLNTSALLFNVSGC